MANEVEIIVRSSDHSRAGIDRAVQSHRNLKRSADDAGSSLGRTSQQSTTLGSSLSRTNQVTEGASMAWAKASGVVAGATLAWAGANKMLNDGIAIGLASANAQVALGDSYGKLEQAAKSQAHQLGLTTSEYLTAAGQTASLAKNMGFATETAAQFGQLMPDLSNKLSIMSGGQRTAAETSDMLRAAIAGEFDPLQAVGINISANIVAQRAMNIQQQNGKKFTDQQANALAVLSIVQEQTADTSKVLATEQGRAAMEAQKNSAELRQAWQDLEHAAVPVLSVVTQYIADFIGATVDLKDAVTGEQGLAGGLKTFLNFASPLTNVIDRWRGKTEEAGDANSEAAPKVDDLAKSSEGAAQSQEAMAKAVEEATRKIEEQADVVLDGRDAARNFEQAIDDAAAAVKENGRTLDRNTQAGRDNEEALDAIAQAALDQARAVREAGGSEAQFRGSLERSRAALERAAVRFGMTRQAARAYANQVLGIPAARTTRITANTSTARSRVVQLKRDIAGLRDKTVTMTVHYRASGDVSLRTVQGGRVRTSTARAMGGIVGSDGDELQTAQSGGIRSRLTLVGEQGPELVRMAPGSQVMSNPDTERMLGGGGPTGPIVLDIRSSGSEVDDLLLMLMRRAIRKRSRASNNVQVVLGGSL